MFTLLVPPDRENRPERIKSVCRGHRCPRRDIMLLYGEMRNKFQKTVA